MTTGTNNNSTFKYLLGAVVALLILVAGWVVMINVAQAAAGERIAVNETRIEYLRENIREINDKLGVIADHLVKGDKP